MLATPPARQSAMPLRLSPDHQGHGYGRALLAHAEELARSFGLNELRLYTSIHLTDNVKL
jgi:GNAT superfamily N-acetyltransferase